MVTLTNEEVEKMHSDIAAGKLPPDAWAEHLKGEEKAVFGHDVRHDRKGKPIEVGIGSALQPSHNSVEAYRVWCRNEPKYAENLARMEKELAEYEARTKAARS
jgi:hypothetical protein